MVKDKQIEKRNTLMTCAIVTVIVLMISIALSSFMKGEARSLEKVTYPTTFKLSQSDTTYSFSELTYILKDNDKQHYYVMEPEYYYYHWAEIEMRLQYPEREDPLVYWDDKSMWDYENADFHIYEDAGLTKQVNINGSEFVELNYNFNGNYSDITFSLGSILDLLDENGESQDYFIVIDPHMTATTEHEGTPIVIEFKYKDTEYTTTRKSHSTTTTTTPSDRSYTVSYGDERDPVSRGIHINQPSVYRTKTTTTTGKTTTTRTTQRTISTQTETQSLTEPTTKSSTQTTSKTTRQETGSGQAGSTTTKKEAPTENENISVLEGLVRGPDGKWAVYKNGVVDKSVTSVVGNQNGWYRVKNGYVDWSANGIYKNQYGWWKCTNGKVLFNEIGVFKNENGWWRVENSKVNFKANGIYQNKYGWWKTTGGKVTFKENGVFKNENGWWKVEGSKVNFNFTGIASNKNGTWFLKNGKVDFSKNGKVTFNGQQYIVKNGKVQ